MSASTTTSPPANPPLLKRLVIDHPLVAFFILAFLGGWLVLAPTVLFESGFGLIPINIPAPAVMLSFIPAAMAGPALAAFVVTRMVEGKEGTRKLLRRRILRWRVGIQWYLIAIFGIPLVYVAAASFVLGTAPLEALIEDWPLFFTTYLPKVVMVFLIVSLWEEIGWMGFALPRLQDKFGPLMASAVLGVLWALWHLPAYFNSTQVVDPKVGLADLDRLLYLLPLLMLLAVSTRIVMTWLFNSAAGSVVIVTLFHAGFNISNNEFIPTLVPELNRMFANNEWIYAVLGVLALLLLVFTKGRLSYKPEHAAPAARDAQEASSSKVARHIPGSNISSR
jgi:membrane protease YdiL (CAAX protease family)